MQRPTTLATYTLFKASIRCQLTTGPWVRCTLTRAESLAIEYGSAWPGWLNDDYLAFCAAIDAIIKDGGLGLVATEAPAGAIDGRTDEAGSAPHEALPGAAQPLA